jgi:feruloyl esterase
MPPPVTRVPHHRTDRFGPSARIVGLVVLLAVLACSSTFAQEPPRAMNCEQLAQRTFAGVTILEARSVAAGTFAGPRAVFTNRDLTELYKFLPAFCRVVAVAKPVADSEIGIEVWLPASGWNGKLQGLGNGGFAGLIDHQNLAEALRHGYVAAATDAGHKSPLPVDASWAPGHPEKVADFGHRGVHEMTRAAKELALAFFGERPKRAYFAGCSDGGREALMEAQRYPEDYDGILAGAPANNWTALLTFAVWHTRALTQDPASFIPPAKIPSIAAAVNAACDGLDGVKDGILDDPRECRFDPSTIQCKSGEDTSSCLTGPQVAALRNQYEVMRDARGQRIYPGYLPGAEDGPGGWATWVTGPEPGKSLMAYFGFNYYGDMVYGKSGWDPEAFDIERDMRAAIEKTGAVLDATNPDLGPFSARGGKLVVYHGWQDPAIPALGAIDYYEQVAARMGREKTGSFMRLYMAPGLQHCGGGPGPDLFGQAGDWTSDDPSRSLRVSLERWVEQGTAPAMIIAAKRAEGGSVVMTRPLCAHPEVARYIGAGDPKDAASYGCTAPR